MGDLISLLLAGLFGLAGLPLWWALRNKRGVERRQLPPAPRTAGEIAAEQEAAAKAAQEERRVADAELRGEVKQAGREAEDAAEYLKESFKL